MTLRKDYTERIAIAKRTYSTIENRTLKELLLLRAVIDIVNDAKGALQEEERRMDDFLAQVRREQGKRLSASQENSALFAQFQAALADQQNLKSRVFGALRSLKSQEHTIQGTREGGTGREG